MQAAGGTPLTRAGRDAGRRTHVALLLVAALSVLALDVATKVWVVSWAPGRELVLLDGAVVLRESRNSGAAFGLAQGATVILSVVALGVVAVIARTARRLRSRRWALALGLILGGALGNLVDRVLRDPAPLRGAVVDFIDLTWWPSFNVADSGIVVGGMLAVGLSMLGVDPAGSEAPVADADEESPSAGDTES